LETAVARNRTTPARARVFAVAIAICAVAALLGAPDALAHAVLLRATPSGSQTLAQAPDRVQLLFSEPVDPAFSNVQVLDAAGARVDLADSQVDPNNDRLLTVSLKPGLGNGIYTVDWRTLSAVDVHPDEGQYHLFIGVPVLSEATVQTGSQITATPETTLGRWWFYLAASLFGGVLATWKLVLSPLVQGDEKLRRRAHRMVIAGGVFLILGTLFSALAQAAAAAGVPLLDGFGQPLASLLTRGRFASIWWPRLGLEVASLGLIAVGGLDGLASECALATLPAVLLTSALTSHGAALPAGAAAGIAIDWLHIVGATLWVGGLMALVAFVPELGLKRGVVDRFGRLALIASMIVLLSGVLQGALEVGSPGAFFSTFYGQLLLVKIVLLVGMLALAAVNQARGSAVGVRVELVVGVVVFGVAAVLSGTPPTPNL
jgi:copper transport protein